RVHTCHLANVLRDEIQAVEHGVAKHLEEFGDGSASVFRGEAFQIDWQNLPELDEQVSAEHSVIVLNEIQIARRNAQSPCQLGLREMLLTTEGAKPCTERRDSFSHNVVCYRVDVLQSLQIYNRCYHSTADLHQGARFPKAI